MPNGPRERSRDHFGKPLDPSQVWLGCWLWLVEMAGKDELWYGHFGCLVVYLAEAPFRM